MSPRLGFMAVKRLLGPELERQAWKSPVVVLTGPRQSGKTTLVRATFPKLPYENLEAPLEAVAELIPEIRERLLVHGGARSFSHGGARALGYRELDSIRWREPGPTRALRRKRSVRAKRA
jgi:hypothetical protein